MNRRTFLQSLAAVGAASLTPLRWVPPIRSAQATLSTYALPNYVEQIFALTPVDTPFLAAIGHPDTYKVAQIYGELTLTFSDQQLHGRIVGLDV